MSARSIQFLTGPREIRRAIGWLTRAKRNATLDAAVAFVGAEWKPLLADYGGPMRLLCWLRNPATNPDAISVLMKRKRTTVKQRDWMHAKVYIVPNVGAIVGSANLSKPALSAQEQPGQSEAAVLMTDPSLVKSVSKWFEKLWRSQPTRPITGTDLEEARRARLKSPPPKMPVIHPVPSIPNPLSKALWRLADQVRDIKHLEKHEALRERHELLQSISPRAISFTDRNRIVEHLAGWTKHPSVFKTFKTQSIARVRRGLSLLFDVSEDIIYRLGEVEHRHLLRGLRLPSMSILLYWWDPDSYPPFDAKTRRFLKDFRLTSRGMSASSPRCYGTWLEFARQLATKLDLPQPGYVDRMVTLHYGEVTHRT
jgi:hypothetical protein